MSRTRHWSRFQCPRCGRCSSSRVATLSYYRDEARFNALGAGDVARAFRGEIVSEGDSCFNALGAGDVARARTTDGAYALGGRFQCPRCGRCSSSTEWVSNPALVFTRFNALGAGDVARATAYRPWWRGRLAFQCPRCGRCSSSTEGETGQRWLSKFQCPRCGRCSSSGATTTTLPKKSCFNALGAGDVARARRAASPRRRTSSFQCPRCGRCSSSLRDFHELEHQRLVSMPSVRAM